MFEHGELLAAVLTNATTWPAGLGYDPKARFYPPEHLLDFASELSRCGRGRDEIGGIFGGRLMLVARKVWR